MADRKFKYRVTDGWLRDLASEPTPADPWPCIRWDDQVAKDQRRFLDAQVETDMEYNLVWGFFVDRSWPVPFQDVVDAERARRLRAFTRAAHRRGLRVLSGMGVYSWGFDEVIAKVPGVSAGHRQAMCAQSDAAWDWQRRVLDFVMDPRWDLDGISMQSADLGRCECPACRRMSPAEHHALLLIRCADYVRANRPDWIIGQACWGLRMDEPGEMKHIRAISQKVDYMVEVRERSAEEGRRAQFAGELSCAFGSVGGVFVEPPQHWDRLRWFVPCGLGSARALKRLWEDGGSACEYFYRPFGNPGEEVSWRAGARIMSAPEVEPEAALREAVEAVYGMRGHAAGDLADWFARAEDAYFSRSSFRAGQGSLSLEPLIWKEDPAAPGPAVYLQGRMTPEARADYACELQRLKSELAAMKVRRARTVQKTLTCIDGTLREIAALA
jgi:hypothetical protein